MRCIFKIVAAIALGWSSSGCHDEHNHGSPATTPTAAKSDDHGHGHAHSHGPEMKETLGLVSAGPYEVVAVQNSKFKPGGEMNFDVEILGQPKPKAVRFWVGTQGGEGSTKADPLSEKDNVYHVDIDLPATLPAGSKLWVEIQPPEGPALPAGFELKA